ncbi:MAG: hypothetical protein AAF988_05495 [Pseudomonadota bacterium]
MSIILEERDSLYFEGGFEVLVKVDSQLIEPINGDPNCTEATAIFNQLNQILADEGFKVEKADISALPTTEGDFNFAGWNVPEDTTATHLIVGPKQDTKRRDIRTRFMELLSETFDDEGKSRMVLDEHGFLEDRNNPFGKLTA